MPLARDIRRRIRGVQNTRKITHAMELVAAAKMRRAITAVVATRRYADLAWEFLVEVRRRAEVARHPLLVGRSAVARELLLVISGNRGLVGAFHQKLAALAFDAIRTSVVPVDVVVTGRVAARLLRRAGAAIVADFPKKDLLGVPEDAAPLAEFLLRRFLEGGADRVRMAYANFRSPTRQEPRLKTLLPIGGVPITQGPWLKADMLFEPSPEAVLRAVVPNLLSIQVYQALVETTASEHAARMVAMQNATLNADELSDDLSLTLNQARQQQITRELQEISAGSLGI